MKQYLLILAVLVLMISTANAISYQWVYQENSTARSCSTGGTANWDGVQTCALTYDEDWGTYGTAATGNTSTVTFNYTKPTYAHNAKWEHKLGIGGAINSTLPTACFSANTQTRIIGNTSAYLQCYNGTAWITGGITVVSPNIYEEAMWWNETVLENGNCGTGRNTCTIGTVHDLTDSATNYLWQCDGYGGGTNDSCSLPKIQWVFTDLGTGLGNFFDKLGPGLMVFIAIIGVVIIIVMLIASFTDLFKGLF